MLNEQDALELAQLEAECLDEGGMPRTDVVADTEKLVRMSELQAKRDEETKETQLDTTQPLEEITVKELKEIAKEKGIKGYANMKRETLLKAIEDTFAKEVTAPEPSEIDRLVGLGYEYLGTNGHAQFYTGPDGRAFMSKKDGRLRSVGNTFGEKLLESLKK